MDRPRRTHAEARAEMRAGILRLGNEQLAAVGAAALSVREIARGLGVASSAIYRHVADRDDLLTLLLVDAYTDLADTVHAKDEPTAAPHLRFENLVRTLRQWAIASPSRWALAYGSPVPGYRAPAERTTGPGTRVMHLFLEILASGSVPSEHGRRDLTQGLEDELVAASEEFGIDAAPPLAAAAVEAWCSMIGLVSAEVFGQLGVDLSGHGDELMERWIHSTILRFGLE
ncbi:TetR/AcrR family transcriptional regulator [Leucobacter sp. GX24907]